MCVAFGRQLGRLEQALGRAAGWIEADSGTLLIALSEDEVGSRDSPGHMQTQKHLPTPGSWARAGSERGGPVPTTVPAGWPVHWVQRLPVLSRWRGTHWHLSSWKAPAGPSEVSWFPSCILVNTKSWHGCGVEGTPNQD